MAQKYSKTTADVLPWDTAMALIRKLYKDGNYRMSLLIGCGCFFGMRIGDLLRLTWIDVMSPSFTITEAKTGKTRTIRVNGNFQSHIHDCLTAMDVNNPSSMCFQNKFGGTITIQMVNRLLKGVKNQYGLNIDHFSTHTLRKTWAREIWENENAKGRGEMALLKLSEIMNHSSPSITRRYIGLRQDELGEVYDMLEF